MRAKAESANRYGVRLVALEAPLDALPAADYLANLVVSETAVAQGAALEAADELARILKPCGGVLWLGGAEDAFSVRGPLEGAGAWTHQYADPANTACSDELRVKDALGVLWYGEPGPQFMVERHARAAAPVAMDGRLFTQGEQRVMCHDAYNGVELWAREIRGAGARARGLGHEQLRAGPGRALRGRVRAMLRLDPVTGETMHTYALPPSEEPSEDRWGYLAVAGDTLYGTWPRRCPRPMAISGKRWSAKTANGLTSRPSRRCRPCPANTAPTCNSSRRNSPCPTTAPSGTSSSPARSGAT